MAAPLDIIKKAKEARERKKKKEALKKSRTALRKNRFDVAVGPGGAGPSDSGLRPDRMFTLIQVTKPRLGDR